MNSYYWFSNVCKVRVGDVVTDKRPVESVHLGTSIGTVLDIMKENKITTIAVYGSPNNCRGESALRFGQKQYLGILTIAHILEFLLACPSHLERLGASVLALLEVFSKEVSIRVQCVTKPLFFSMVQFSTGIRHALIVDQSTREPMMLSQSDLVSFLIDHESSMPHMAAVLNRSIGSMGSRVMEQVLPDTMMRDAISKLLKHRVIPVVASDGTLLTTLSTVDLLDRHRLRRALDAPITVIEFIALCHDGLIPPAMVLSDDATMRDASLLLRREKLHCVWINPEETHPFLRVISLTDVLYHIFSGEVEEKE